MPLEFTQVSKDEEITEEMVEKLFTSPEHDNARREADTRRKGLSEEERYIMRAQAKRDLFFLSYGVLQYDRLSTDLHGDLCGDIEETENERFRLYLLPRGHFKSTIITIAHSIQVSLPYDEKDREHDEIAHIPLSWPQSLGMNCRLLIAHETAESAARYLYSITGHFTRNITLMTLFPECVPDRKAQRVNKWELELPRSRIWNEPTFDTMGVGGKSQGRHYNLIDLDDIFGDKARDSPTEANTTRNWLDNIQSFFSKFDVDHLLINGTRYSFDDAYAHLMERYGPKKGSVGVPEDKIKEDGQLHVYRRSVVEWNKATQSKEPIFPEEFTHKGLAILKKNKEVYNAQYLNDPDASGEGFEKEWKRRFYWKSATQIVMFDNQAGEVPRSAVVNIRDMDRIILIDPGEKSGGFVVVGTDHIGRIATLVALRIEMKSPELLDFLFFNVNKWQPRLVAIEADFFMHTIQHWARSEMKLRGTYFHIEPAYTKKTAKDKRIWGLAPYMKDGRIYTNETQEDLDREWDQFGKTEDIHILDAFAYYPEFGQKGKFPGTHDKELMISNKDSHKEEGRDFETGYSVI